MKFHWGHKIALVYTLFAGFMVFMLLMSKRGDHELVTQDYYAKELKVQGRIEANKNMNEADFDVQIKVVNNQIILHFEGPDSLYSPSGVVNLYKPDKKAFDEEHSLVLDGTNQMVLAPKANQGRYHVELYFELEGVSYFKEKNVMI